MKTAIIDLASMLHKLWHVDHDNVTNRVVSFLKTLQYDEIIIAIDAPPYKRKESYPQYKANRDTPDPEQIGCFDYTIKKVLSEGFKIASAEGWEADDVIATIINDMTDKGTYSPSEVIVYGADKDLLQITELVDPISGEQKNANERYGLAPFQVPDFLALTGDTSDNVPGVKGVGEKTAIALLGQFETIDGIYEAIEKKPELFTKPAIFESLKSSRELVNTSLSLVTLNCACDVKYRKEEQKPIDVEAIEIPAPEDKIPEQKQTTQQVVLRTEPTSYRNSLEPIDMNQAWKAACIFQKAGLYSNFKGPEQVLMVLMRGRELGFGATTSLDVIDLIQGKPAMKAAAMLALTMQHKEVCEYIYCEEMTDTRSTWVTKRFGVPKEQRRTFTIDDAIKMEYIIPEGKIIKDKWGKEKYSKEQWLKQPAVMLQWRACSQLIRQVYPDIICGMYSIEELE